MPRAIKHAAFVPADMHLQARGRYTIAGDRVSFRILGWSRELKMGAQPNTVEREVLLRAAVDYSGEVVVLRPLQ